MHMLTCVCAWHHICVLCTCCVLCSVHAVLHAKMYHACGFVYMCVLYTHVRLCTALCPMHMCVQVPNRGKSGPSCVVRGCHQGVGLVPRGSQKSSPLQGPTRATHSLLFRLAAHGVSACLGNSSRFCEQRPHVSCPAHSACLISTLR